MQPPFHVHEISLGTCRCLHAYVHLKALVYATSVGDVGTLRNRIVAGSETIRNFPGIHQHILVSMQRRFPRDKQCLRVMPADVAGTLKMALARRCSFVGMCLARRACWPGSCRSAFPPVFTARKRPTTRRTPFTLCGRWRLVGLLSSHLGEPGSIPGGVASRFLHVGIVPHDAPDRRVFSGIFRFPHPCIRRCSILSRFTLIGLQASRHFVVNVGTSQVLRRDLERIQLATLMSARLALQREFSTKTCTRHLYLLADWDGLPRSRLKKRGSDTGDTNTHALYLIAPTRMACSVSVVTLYCCKLDLQQWGFTARDERPQIFKKLCYNLKTSNVKIPLPPPLNTRTAIISGDRGAGGCCRFVRCPSIATLNKTIVEGEAVVLWSTLLPASGFDGNHLLQPHTGGLLIMSTAFVRPHGSYSPPPNIFRYTRCPHTRGNHSSLPRGDSINTARVALPARDHRAPGLQTCAREMSSGGRSNPPPVHRRPLRNLGYVSPLKQKPPWNTKQITTSCQLSDTDYQFLNYHCLHWFGSILTVSRAELQREVNNFVNARLYSSAQKRKVPYKRTYYFGVHVDMLSRVLAEQLTRDTYSVKGKLTYVYHSRRGMKIALRVHKVCAFGPKNGLSRLELLIVVKLNMIITQTKKINSAAH
ncbi:hypothetical protein PR048_006631 [Dryococelus australis]|uniref:Uncharacterized protein n=1 Tax=Dryococelus australis TaxID=614101 RepID=A0ABQ9ICG4_9NEOP|nr:hypothetical protein PR048_006631 [Dryococelus australis]